MTGNKKLFINHQIRISHICTACFSKIQKSTVLEIEMVLLHVQSRACKRKIVTTQLANINSSSLVSSNSLKS